MPAIGLYEDPSETAQIDTELAVQRGFSKFTSAANDSEQKAKDQLAKTAAAYATGTFSDAADLIDQNAPEVNQTLTSLSDGLNKFHNSANQSLTQGAISKFNALTPDTPTTPTSDTTSQLSPDFSQPDQPSDASSDMSADNISPPDIAQPATGTPTGTPMPDQSASSSVGTSNQYEAMARKAAQDAGINPDLFVRQLNAESGMNPYNDDGSVKTSSAGALGIAQFMPQTAQGLGIDPTDPQQSITAAAQYMKDKGATTDPSTWDTALARYNAGDNGNWNNPETIAYVDKIKNGVSSVAPHDNTDVQQATADASQAGAEPADLAWAYKHLGTQDYIGLCQEFVDKAQGHGPTGASAEDAWSKSDTRVADPTLQGIQPGDAIHFQDPNNENGHVGIYEGNGRFFSATNDGPESYNLDTWTKLTGQRIRGYIPNDHPGPASSTDNLPVAGGILGAAHGALNAIGQKVSDLGSNFQTLHDPLANWLHEQDQGGKPLTSDAVEQARQQALTSDSGYADDQFADMVWRGMNPVNPLDIGHYVGKRALDSLTHAISGDKSYEDSGFSKIPVVGGLVGSTVEQPVETALLMATGGIGKGAELGADVIKAAAAGDMAAKTAILSKVASDFALNLPGMASRAAVLGGTSAINAAEDPSATPESSAGSAALNAAIGVGADIGLPLASKVRGVQHPLIQQLADATKSTPEAVTKDLASAAASEIAPALEMPKDQVQAQIEDKLNPMAGGAPTVLMQPGDKIVYRGDKQPLEGEKLDLNKLDDNALYGPAGYHSDNPALADSYATAGNAAPIEGGNTRAVILPKDLNLLDVGDKTLLSRGEVQRIIEALPKEAQKKFPLDVGSQITSEDLYQALNTMFSSTEGQVFARALIPEKETTTHWSINGATKPFIPSKVGVNNFLSRLGYDGVAYDGGRISPLKDASGNDIHHQAYAIFPESMSKMRNAITGMKGGSPYIATNPEDIGTVDHTFTAPEERDNSPLNVKLKWSDLPPDYLANAAHGASNTIYGEPTSTVKSDLTKIIGQGEIKSQVPLAKGLPVTKDQLPDTLYHVTTNAKDVEHSGRLLVDHPNKDTGLGGDTGEGVSLTASYSNAVQVRKDMIRAGDIARGKVNTIAQLMDIARKDEDAAGLAPGSLTKLIAKSSIPWLQGVNQNKPLDSGTTFHEFKNYLYARARATNDKIVDPTFVNPVSSYDKLDNNSVRLLHIPRSSIPDEPVITREPNPGDLNEIRVHGDVPIERGATNPKGIDEGGQSNVGLFAAKNYSTAIHNSGYDDYSGTHDLLLDAGIKHEFLKLGTNQPWKGEGPFSLFVDPNDAEAAAGVLGHALNLPSVDVVHYDPSTYTSLGYLYDPKEASITNPEVQAELGIKGDKLDSALDRAKEWADQENSEYGTNFDVSATKEGKILFSEIGYQSNPDYVTSAGVPSVDFTKSLYKFLVSQGSTLDSLKAFGQKSERINAEDYTKKITDHPTAADSIKRHIAVGSGNPEDVQANTDAAENGQPVSAGVKNSSPDEVNYLYHFPSEEKEDTLFSHGIPESSFLHMHGLVSDLANDPSAHPYRVHVDNLKYKLSDPLAYEPQSFTTKEPIPPADIQKLYDTGWKSLDDTGPMDWTHEDNSSDYIKTALRNSELGKAADLGPDTSVSNDAAMSGGAPINIPMLKALRGLKGMKDREIAQLQAAVNNRDPELAGKLYGLYTGGAALDDLSIKSMDNLTEAIARAKQAKIDSFAALKPRGPALEDGNVRLYHGYDTSVGVGNSFHTAYGAVKPYMLKAGDNGAMKYLDVPKDELNDLDPNGHGGYYITDAMKAQAKDMPSDTHTELRQALTNNDPKAAAEALAKELPNTTPDKPLTNAGMKEAAKYLEQKDQAEGYPEVFDAAKAGNIQAVNDALSGVKKNRTLANPDFSKYTNDQQADGRTVVKSATGLKPLFGESIEEPETPAQDATKNTKEVLSESDQKFLTDMVKTNLPNDARNFVINQFVSQPIGAAAGAYYGATQDPNDSVQTKILKAALYGAAGMSAGHILTGGPVNQLGTRAAQTYVNGLLSTGTGLVKSFNDGMNILTRPTIRGVDAFLSGQGPKDATQQALQGYLHSFSGFTIGLRAMLKELDPYTIGKNLEYDMGDISKEQQYHLLDLGYQGAEGNLDSIKELRGELNKDQSLPSTGQYISSLPSRMIRGITALAQHILTQQEEYANAVLDPLHQADVTENVKQALLTNSPKGLYSEGMYKLYNTIGSVPGIGGVLAPFRLIPSNMLGQLMEFIPGFGLPQMISLNAARKGIMLNGGHFANSQASSVMAKQLIGLAAIGGTLISVHQFGAGPAVTGRGPTDEVANKNWLALGNRPWTVRLADGQVAIRQIPPILQGPLRVLGAIDDINNKHYGTDQIPQVVGRDFYSSLQDHQFFPAMLKLLEQSIDSSSGLKVQDLTTFERSAADQLGSIVPSYLRMPAQAERPYQADATGKGVDFGTMAKQAIEANLPGLEKNVPNRIGSSGEPLPNPSAGGQAFAGSYKGLTPHSDPVAELFSKAGMVQPATPSTLNVPGLSSNQGAIQMTPEEMQTYHQLEGAMLAKYARGIQNASFTNNPEVLRTVMNELVRQVRQAVDQQMLGQANKAGLGNLSQRITQGIAATKAKDQGAALNLGQ